LFFVQGAGAFRSIRLPIGGKDRIMITLQELLDRVDAAPASRVKRVTTRTVSESGAEVVVSLSTHDGSLLQVFKNGYVIYRSGRRGTVFHISWISDGYSYSTVDIWNRKNMFIPMNELLNMPWYFALLLIAEDRIASNFDSHKVLSWSVEDMPDRIVSDAMKRNGNAASDNEDPLQIVISNETIELVCYAMTKLNDRQREILIDFYVREKGITEIGEKFKITIQGVCNSKSRGAKKLNVIVRDLSKVHIRKLRRQ